MSSTKKTSLKRTVVCMAIALTVAIGLGAGFINLQSNATPNPAPGQQNTIDSDGFPEVDWEYWQDINPDVVGWITIPDTNINYPIMQAFESDPEYYLKHDIYKNWNPWGVPFLDVQCKDRGLFSSFNAVVYGHNMLDGSMFEHLVNYSDSNFAEAHRDIYLQTPTTKKIYRVYTADVVRGTDPIKRCNFDDVADYRSWRDLRFEDSQMKLSNDASHVSRTITLCTCSHNYWKNERTIVYASPIEDARNSK
ncbi:MAG: class B sortase [Eggerthellaceae bacterium]|nr:class B sortase [Eggerthellaceae bacterium]